MSKRLIYSLSVFSGIIFLYVTSYSVSNLVDITIDSHFWFGDGAPKLAVPHVCLDKTRNIPCKHATCVAVFSIYG